MRIRTAHLPAVKTLEDFNLDHPPSMRRDVLAHLATGTFVAKAENVILLGPPGIGKTHLAIGLGVTPSPIGQRIKAPNRAWARSSWYGESPVPQHLPAALTRRQRCALERRPQQLPSPRLG
jgi:hypothetical protein